jgi:hypothetical protein
LQAHSVCNREQARAYEHGELGQTQRKETSRKENTGYVRKNTTARKILFGGKTVTAGQMIKALQLGIKNGHYAKDDMLTVATSKNGISYDGQIEVESVGMEIFCGKAGITLKGPVLEVKGRVRRS